MTDIELSAADDNKTSGQDIQVFVSYSRADAAFVEKLSRGLAVLGITALVDRKDIADLEAWWSRIQGLIEAAHAVVFVLSARWLTSDVCRKELTQAAELGKRLAPIVIDPAIGRPPDELGRINWLTFGSDDFEAKVDRLAVGLKTNIDWIREQTRLIGTASQWDRTGRPDGALLRGDSLSGAETLLMRRPADAPPPALVLTEYMSAAKLSFEREQSERKALLDRMLIFQSRTISAHARRLLEDGNAGSALLLALEALPDEEEGVVRPLVSAAETVCRDALISLRERVVLWLDGQDFHDAAFTDDGAYVVAVSFDGLVMWETQSGRALLQLKGTPTAISGDGITFAVKCDDAMQLWRFDPAKYQVQLDTSYPIIDENRIWQSFATGQVGWVTKTNINGPALIRARFLGDRPPAVLQPQNIDFEAENIQLSADEARIVATPSYNFSFPTTVATFNARTGAKLADLGGHESYVASAKFSTDGERIVTASYDRTARVWDANTGTLLAELQGHDAEVACAEFAPYGKIIVTGSYDGSYRLWDPASGRQLAILRGHIGEVPKTSTLFKGFAPSARFCMDESQVVTTWKDGTVRLWRVDPAAASSVFTVDDEPITAVCFSADGSALASASTRGSIVIWDPAALQRRLVIQAKTEDIAFSPDGTTLASSTPEGIILWSALTGGRIRQFDAAVGGRRLAWSPDGTKIASAVAFESRVDVWDVATGVKLSSFNEGNLTGYDVSIAPSGLVAVSCGDERAVRFWDIKTGSQLGGMRLHESSVLAVAYDAAGERIVTAGDDRTAVVCTIGADLPEGAVVLLGHDSSVNSARFSPSGDTVVTASDDATVRLWNSKTGQQILKLEGHTAPVKRAVFNPDGSSIVSCSNDGTIRVWRTLRDTQSLVASAKQAVPRLLTRDERAAASLEPEPPRWHTRSGKWPYQQALTAL